VPFSTDNMPDQKMTAAQRCKGPAVMKIGTITKTVLRTERPYGFIAVPGEAREYYFRIPRIETAHNYHVGQRVIFQAANRGGRPFADNVAPISMDSVPNSIGTALGSPVKQKEEL
jgi:cold shock CspA family protein